MLYCEMWQWLWICWSPWYDICNNNHEHCIRGHLLKVHGFHHSIIKFCTLHTLNLGLCLWTAGSAILELLKLEVACHISTCMHV